MVCKIISSRKTSRMVFLEVDDGEYWGLKKISVEDFDFAKSFRNNELLGMVSRWTTGRDFHDSVKATPFVDPMISYSL